MKNVYRDETGSLTDAEKLEVQELTANIGVNAETNPEDLKPIRLTLSTGKVVVACPSIVVARAQPMDMLEVLQSMPIDVQLRLLSLLLEAQLHGD